MENQQIGNFICLWLDLTGAPTYVLISLEMSTQAITLPVRLVHHLQQHDGIVPYVIIKGRINKVHPYLKLNFPFFELGPKRWQCHHQYLVGLRHLLMRNRRIYNFFKNNLLNPVDV